MALFYPDSVQYYHPLDDVVEQTLSSSWGNTGGEFVSGVVVSGYRKTGAAGNAFLRNDSDNQYPDLSGATSACCLFWARELYDAAGFGDEKRIEIGHADATGQMQNGLRLTRFDSSASVVFLQRNSTVGSKSLTGFPTDSGNKLVLIDARQDGSVWRLRISHSGAAWVDLGTLGDTTTFDQDPRTYISTYRGAGSNSPIADEVVLWKNNPLFTTEELQNLYDLYIVHNTTMNNYSTTYPSLINDQVTLFIHGYDTITDTINLYIPGQLETDALDLFTHGWDTENKNLDLSTEGYLSETQNIDLFINGIGFISDNCDLFLQNKTALFNVDNVIFYHPCNDSTEFSRNESWAIDNLDFSDSILTSGIISTQNVDYGEFRGTGNYSSLFGATRFTACFWSSGFYDSSTTYNQIEIGTDYDGYNNGNINNGMYIDTQPVSIYGLGAGGYAPDPFTAPDTPGWHFTVLDMVQEEDTGWRKRVSFNGSGWQDCGTAGIGTSFGNDAAVKISTFSLDPPGAVIIDEVVLWRDTELFTDQELLNLYELYNTHNQTIDQYNNIYGNPINRIISLYISTFGVVNNSINLYIPGQVETDRINLFLCNKQVIDNIDLYIPGQLESNRIDFFIHGRQTLSDNINLFLFNQYFDSGIDLFIKGVETGNWNIFVRVADTRTVKQLPLIIYGSTEPLSFINNSVDLFIKQIEQRESVIGDWSIFVKAEEASLVATDQTFQVFVKAGNTTFSSIPFYTQGHPSGENPNGILINNTIEFFIDGLGELINENFIPINNVFDIFVGVQSGVVDNIDLFIDGFIFPSQILDLYTFGISGIINDDLDLYIRVSETQVTGLLNLSIFGSLDTINSIVTLFVFTDVVVEVQDFSLYIHGF